MRSFGCFILIRLKTADGLSDFPPKLGTPTPGIGCKLLNFRGANSEDSSEYPRKSDLRVIGPGFQELPQPKIAQPGAHRLG